MISIVPRDYQVEAIDGIAKAYRRGLRTVIVVLPTGAGKTIVFSVLISRKGGRTLVLAHRDELISQAVNKIRMVLPGADIGVVAADRNEHDRRIVVASVATLALPKRLQQISEPWDTVVIDECHHAVTDSYQRIVAAARAANPETLVVGVTATPDRLDGKPLVGEKGVFEECVYERHIADFLPHKRPDGLSDIVTLQVAIDNLHLEDCTRNKGDFTTASLARVMSAADALPRIVAAWKLHAHDRKTIGFFPSVPLARAAAKHFDEAGIAAACIDGTQDSDTRRRILREYADDKFQVLTNCAVATEGFDEPSISCVLMARPTQSRALYVQCIGRGLRLFPGKRDCLVLDVVGDSLKHKLVGVAEVFGLAASDLRSRKPVSLALKAKDEKKINLRDVSMAVASGKTRPVDAFGTLNWVRTNHGNYVLSMGETILRVERHGDDVWRVVRNSYDILADNLPMSYAITVAETEARKLATDSSTKALIEPKARWRREPASEKQLAALRRWRVPIPPGCTKGEAADLLTRAAERVKAR
jgi:superfamily II DNA or RNA helicase